MRDPKPLIGILLAAGRARRMGQTKQLLPWPPESPTPLVGAAFDAVSPICTNMIVALGHDSPAVAGALAPRTFIGAESDPDAPMLESIRAGLAAAAARFGPTDILLHPADHPTVTRATLDVLLEALAADPSRAHVPEYGRKGGHPVLIPASIGAMILDWRGNGGLRRFWIDHPHLCTRHPVTDPGVIFDIDTPPDYQPPRVPS